jgi:hypothetical protein
VVVGAAGRESDSAGEQRFASQLPHRFDVLRGGDGPGGRALTHHVDPQRVVGNLDGKVDRVREAVDRIHVLGKTLPVPAESFGERDTGDVLDAFHQLDQALVVLGAAGGKTDTAASRDARGDAMNRAGCEVRIPGDLAVVVGVDIDEAWGDDRAGRVEDLCGPSLALPDLDDASILHANVGGSPGATGSVDEGATSDFEVVGRHGSGCVPAREDTSWGRHGSWSGRNSTS